MRRALASKPWSGRGTFVSVTTASDQVLARFGNALAALGEGQARTALSRSVNHEGDKGRTRVKRARVKQTGIKYGAVDKAMVTVRATPATLTYTLKARGDETNIAWFGGVQRSSTRSVQVLANAQLATKLLTQRNHHFHAKPGSIACRVKTGWQSFAMVENTKQAGSVAG